MSEAWAPKPRVRVDLGNDGPGPMGRVWQFTGDLPDGFSGFGLRLPDVTALGRVRRRLEVESREIAAIVYEWLTEHGITVSCDFVVGLSLAPR